MPKILIIDDDPQLSQTMLRIMAKMELDATATRTLAQGRDKLDAEAYDLVFLDVRLPDGNGLEALPEMLEAPSRPEVVILTGQGDPDGAELAIQNGAWDYLLKPSSMKQTMLCVERALKYREQKQAASGTTAIDLGGLVGISPKMKACYEQLGLAAASSANVLITGETGTGKELFARTVHRNSARQKNEFVPVDCASLNKELVESALFGHKRGAFTGAEKDRIGLVRVADKGTLFLDEVGDMDLPIQKTFLRVLQERTFRPVGDTREATSDFRLIAATNRDLDKDVEEETFRKDLLYRLKTIHIQLPPLREREGDIKLLATYRVNQLGKQYGSTKKIDPEVFRVLQEHSWPGNVRELFATMETAFVRAADATLIIPRHLPAETRIAATRAHVSKQTSPTPEPETPVTGQPHGSPARSAIEGGATLKGFKTAMEREYLQELHDFAEGDIKRMAKLSGCSQSHLYALLKKAGVSLK